MNVLQLLTGKRESVESSPDPLDSELAYLRGEFTKMLEAFRRAEHELMQDGRSSDADALVCAGATSFSTGHIAQSTDSDLSYVSYPVAL